jgi:hypothetical protein
MANPVNDTKRWVPKTDMSKEDFIDRAKKENPNFQFSKWSNLYEKELRAKSPELFKGEGW